MIIIVNNLGLSIIIQQSNLLLCCSPDAKILILSGSHGTEGGKEGRIVDGYYYMIFIAGDSALTDKSLGRSSVQRPGKQQLFKNRIIKIIFN